MRDNAPSLDHERAARLITGAYNDLQANTPWRVKIDYLSVTSSLLHVYDPITGESFNDPSLYAITACDAAALGPVLSTDQNAWRPAAGRSGYSHSAQHGLGVRIFWGSQTARPLIEIGGAACDALDNARLLHPFLIRHAETVTRIDLAADLTCELSPSEFLSYGRSSRHAASGRASSATGETEYIGSPTSDRRCRVYRYAPPHPRSDALRVEVVLRRELAREAATALTRHPLSVVYSQAAAPFDFRCPQWSLPKVFKEARKTLPNEPTAAGRLRWLEKQIRPAVLEAHRAGLIDLREWLESTQARQGQ